MTQGDRSALFPSAYHNRRLSGRGGFTLIEVLVAFTVLALLTVAVQRGVMMAVGGSVRADERIGAEMVARTLMTAPIATGAEALNPRSGQMTGFHWRLHFEPVELPFSTRTTSEGKIPEWAPLRMIVEVDDQTGNHRLVTVETLRLVKTVAQ